ncbi:MAG: 2'-5' RNA ligase family protein [Sciscionella sp.]
MPSEGQTVLAIPVPAADPLLGSVAARFPGVVREGIRSHVSVQYPFVAAHALDDQVLRVLSELFARLQPMPVTFGECGRRGGFVYLRPDPAEGLEELTRTVRRHWPEVAPSDEFDGEVGPHVTIAMRASDVAADTIEQEVTAALPISAELREAWLAAFEGRWVVHRRFEFGIG